MNDFSVKEPQEGFDRTVVDTLAPVQQILLSETYEIMNPRILTVKSESIYIRDHSSLRTLFVLDKETLNLKHSIVVPEGQGPGEMETINRFDVSLEHIIMNSSNPLKIQIREKNGELVNEFLPEIFFPEGMLFWDDSEILVHSPRSIADGTIFYSINKSGDVLQAFGDVSGEEYNPIRFSGQIHIDDGYLYFAGYSEHVLAKWNRDGELQYAVTTIDDIPTEINHISFLGEEQSIFTFPDHAIFSAIDIDIYTDYWLLIHRGNWDEDPYIQYLDVYNKQNGTYQATFQLPWITGSIAVDEDYLYTLQRLEDGEAYLVIYENNIEQLLMGVSQPS